MNNTKKNLILRNFANLLTISRIILCLPLILFLYKGYLITSWILIIIISLTDIIDGYLARKSKIKSSFGAAIDPLADKLVLITLIMWLIKESTLPFWAGIALIYREFTITAFRGNNDSGLPANKIAKIKTSLLFIGIILLYCPLRIKIFNIEIIYIGYIFYYLGLVLAYISAYKYFKI
tara:strand:- start:21407 stop:21940 length:534 start_codon:yes stop_codon:yes gene_type:complete